MCRIVLFLVTLSLLGLTLVSGQSVCGAQGYDFSGLSGQNYTFTTSSYNYVVQPCGVLAGTACLPGAMFCQIPLNSASGYTITIWNDTVSKTWVPLPNGNGMQLIIEDGSSCGGIPNRESTVVFQCDPSATTPVLISVAEVESCHYRAIFNTTAACTHAPYNGHQVGDAWYSGVCGGGVFDLSPITSFDFAWNSDNSSSTAGYMYYMHVCGNVDNSNCSAVGPSMVCQLSKSSGDAYLITTYNNSVLVEYQLLSNGLSMQIQDGTYCGAIGANRESNVVFVCDPTATTPVFVGLKEVETCWYTSTVRTNAVCNRIDLSSGAAGVSSSAGSTAANNPAGASSSAGSPPSSVSSTAASGGGSPSPPTNNNAAVLLHSSPVNAILGASVIALIGTLLL